MRIRVGHVVMIAALAVGGLGLAGCQGEGDSTSAPLSPEQVTDAAISGRAGSGWMLDRMSRRLELTEAQKSQLKTILERERSAMAASGVFDRGPEAIHEAMKERRERVAEEIAGFLTAEQKTRFDTMKARMGGRGADGVGRGEMLTRELNLSPEQSDQVRQLMEQKRETRHGARAGATHSSGADRAARRALMRAERDKFHAEISALLTPEQRVKFEALISERRQDRPR